MLEYLADHPTARDPDPFAGPDHPMRILTRAVALGQASSSQASSGEASSGEASSGEASSGEVWSGEDAARVAAVFDSLAAEWTARHVDDTKAAPVLDALDRGDVPRSGRWLELGSGTGAGTRLLAGVVGSLVAVDLSAEMLHHAPRDLAPHVRADASALPFPGAAFDALLMVNMLLFPNEVARLLRTEGVVVWVNTLGDQTPIHLPPEDVLTALGPGWTGRTARAGTGFWVTARRG